LNDRARFASCADTVRAHPRAIRAEDDANLGGTLRASDAAS